MDGLEEDVLERIELNPSLGEKEEEDGIITFDSKFCATYPCGA